MPEFPDKLYLAPFGKFLEIYNGGRKFISLQDSYLRSQHYQIESAESINNTPEAS